MVLHNRWVKGFVLGALFAGAAALLTASKSGRENRTMIAEKGSEFRDKARSAIEDKRGKLGEIASEVASKSQSQVERLKKAGRKVSAKEKNILQQGFEQLKDGLVS